MKKIKIILPVACFAFVGLFSCGSDDGPGIGPGGCNNSNAYADFLENEANKLVEAQSAYLDNQTTQTCNNYKTAYLGYYDALEDIFDCVPLGLRGDLQQEIDEAKDEVANICDE